FLFISHTSPAPSSLVPRSLHDALPIYAALNRELRPHGLFFPPSPGGSADVATIGGMVANNASGIYSVKYGGTRDHVRAATLVTGDRKSTRLNSSHQIISYAVFCLKKKK